MTVRWKTCREDLVYCRRCHSTFKKHGLFLWVNKKQSQSTVPPGTPSPAWPLGLTPCSWPNTPWQPPWSPTPGDAVTGTVPRSHRVLALRVPSLALVQPWHCGPAWQSPWTLASKLTSWPKHGPASSPWGSLALGWTWFSSVPLTFLRVGQPWAARPWLRVLHSFWHPSCWMMCKVWTTCEHLKFPSYLFLQNRSIFSWVIVIFSLSDYIWASEITCQASFVETHLYGIHLDRKEDLLLLYKKQNMFVFVLF